ncbi:hypothetical protein SATMO3_19040 [Sporomusa aerivorans]
MCSFWKSNKLYEQSHYIFRVILVDKDNIKGSIQETELVKYD